MFEDLAIHPVQVDWLAAISRGEKVLYHSAMNLLHCFLPTFNASEGEYLTRWVFPGMYEIIYPLDRREIVGIVFWTLDGLLRDTDLLSTQDAEGNLSPLTIFEYGVQWLATNHPVYQRMTDQRKEEVFNENEKCEKFLQNYPLLVPSTLWSKALPARHS